MIILWWLFIAAQFPSHFIAPNTMKNQKGKRYQGLRAIESFEQENTRSDLKCCDDQRKCKTISQTTVNIPRIQGTFSDKVAPDMDDFTDKLELQRDIQVMKNTFEDDSK